MHPWEKKAAVQSLRSNGKFVSALCLAHFNYRDLPEGIRVCWDDVLHQGARKSAQVENKDIVDIVHTMVSDVSVVERWEAECPPLGGLLVVNRHPQLWGLTVAGSQCEVSELDLYKRAVRSLITCVWTSTDVNSLLIRNLTVGEIDRSNVEHGGNCDLEKVRKFWAIKNNLTKAIGKEPNKAQLSAELSKVECADPRNRLCGPKKLALLSKCSDAIIDVPEIDEAMQTMKLRHGEEFMVHSLNTMTTVALVPEATYTPDIVCHEYDGET